MRFKSRKTNGYVVYAVSGVNTISFAIDPSGGANISGLLGFAVEREDLVENEKYFMTNFKVFKEIIPDPGPETAVTTFDHPVQSFVWDDFTAKPGYRYNYYFYPVKGKPKNLKREKPVKISVVTEKITDTKQKHDVFFNRGVASSQAYARRFNNLAPEKIPDPARRQEAYKWLGRDLPAAMLSFIEQARKGDTLLACVYEFRYLPVVQAFKAAIDRGVNVRIVMDAKANAGDFPRKDNLDTVRAAGLPPENIRLREARQTDIQHNKFIVYIEGKSSRPRAVWTGSTNISEGGIFGQTNVGHWVRDAEVAEKFRKYWELMQTDPGGRAGESRDVVKQKNTTFKQAVEAIQQDLDPLDLNRIPNGVTVIFSPRLKDTMLDVYGALLDRADQLSCITLAFGVSDKFKELLRDNTPASHMTFLLLEKEDTPDKKEKEGNTFLRLNASHNVYSAFGSFLEEPLYQWARETNTGLLKLNHHVQYIHSKFLLSDPLGSQPIVVTGSANFSVSSTTDNDENMILVKGDQRVADIYFTEFNRLFFHYYFRSVYNKLGDAASPDSMFIKTDAEEWLSKYVPGSLKHKRIQVFANMKGAVTRNFKSLPA